MDIHNTPLFLYLITIIPLEHETVQLVKVKVQKAKWALRTEKMEHYLRKEETQVYVIGTRVLDFPSSLHIRCRLRYEAIHRYQSILYELNSCFSTCFSKGNKIWKIDPRSLLFSTSM